MEYVIYKGKGDILYSVTDETEPLLQGFGGYNRGATITLPSEPCDLELFRDTLHAVLTKVIEEKRNGTTARSDD